MPSLKLSMKGFPPPSTKGAGTAAAGRDMRTPGISSTCSHAAAGFAAPFLFDQKWGTSLLGEKTGIFCLKPADMGSPGFGLAKQVVLKTFENFKMVWGDEYIQVCRSIFKHSNEHLCMKAMHYLLFYKNSWGLQVTAKWQP